MQHHEMISPVWDALNEVVSCRVHSFDRPRTALGELHQRQALTVRTGEADDIQVLGGASRCKPSGCRAAANQEPFSVEAISCKAQKLLDANAIEALLGHGGNVRLMADAWQILRDAGLPLAMERTTRRVDVTELGAAVRTAIDGAPGGRDAEALAAFVLAWSQHWPTSFAAVCSPDVVTWADAHRADENRYLKLRRIALANLATVL